MDAPTPAQIARAFEIADEAMFELLHSEGMPLADPGAEVDALVIGLVDENCMEVTKLAQASQALRDAFEWLQQRGYVELGSDTDGEYVQVLRRPGEDT
jgi:hypothetical protein